MAYGLRAQRLRRHGGSEEVQLVSINRINARKCLRPWHPPRPGERVRCDCLGRVESSMPITRRPLHQLHRPFRRLRCGACSSHLVACTCTGYVYRVRVPCTCTLLSLHLTYELLFLLPPLNLPALFWPILLRVTADDPAGQTPCSW